MRTTRRRLAASSRRPAFWRVTAGIAALLLAGLLFLFAPGGVQVLRAEPGSLISRMPSWSRPCVRDTPPPGETGALGFCARVRGRVIGFVPAAVTGERERHVLVAGDFHLTLVELGKAMATPALGSTITAVGPLQRASFGLREMIALAIHE